MLTPGDYWQLIGTGKPHVIVIMQNGVAFSGIAQPTDYISPAIVDPGGSKPDTMSIVTGTCRVPSLVAVSEALDWAVDIAQIQSVVILPPKLKSFKL